MLLAISKHSVDLTEKQCLRLIMTAAGNGGEESSGAKKTTKSAKKTKKGIQEEEGDAGATAASTLESVDFFLAVVEAIMSRPGGSDASVLGETLRSLPVVAVSTLLKALAMMLRGLCSQDSGIASSDMSDVAIQNILTWIEAILEAHFQSIVLGSHLSSSNGLHGALSALLIVVKDINPAIDLTESALGLCTHIHRMNKHNQHNRGSQISGVDGVQWSSEGANGVYQLSVVRF